MRGVGGIGRTLARRPGSRVACRGVEGRDGLFLHPADPEVPPPEARSSLFLRASRGARGIMIARPQAGRSLTDARSAARAARVRVALIFVESDSAGNTGTTLSCLG